MALESQYSLRSPGVKRLLREAKELANATEEYYACPLEDNLFEWHFTVRGPSETEFEGGYYHGRILLPPQYPMQPPNIILLTPNGRFEVNKKICLSISGYHPETWQPSWSIRTALLALIAFMPTKSVGTIGSLDYTTDERKDLAKKSKLWECSVCGRIADQLVSVENGKTPQLTQEEQSMLENISLKAEEETNKKDANLVTKIEGKLDDKPPDASEEAVMQEVDSSFKPKGRAVPFNLSTAEENRSAEDAVRQRNVPCPSTTETVQHQEITDEILRASIERSKRDKFWTLVSYIIVALIVLLLVRRLIVTSSELL